MRTRSTPGALTVEVGPGTQVQYTAATNTVQVIHLGEVVRTEVAPRRYTAAAFAETCRRVRAVMVLVALILAIEGGHVRARVVRIEPVTTDTLRPADTVQGGRIMMINYN